MADDTTIPSGARVATDELATLNGVATAPDGNGRVPTVQRVKAGFGSDGDLRDVDAGHPLPVTDPAVAAAVTALVAYLDGLEGNTAGLASQATLAAILAKLIASPATEATLAGAKTVLDNQLAAGAGDVAAALTDGRKTVTTPATAVALRASLACKWVTATALKSNTDQVNVGGSTVLATSGSSTGTPLAAGQAVTVPVTNASLVFVDARVAGEGVSFTVGS